MTLISIGIYNFTIWLVILPLTIDYFTRFKFIIAIPIIFILFPLTVIHVTIRRLINCIPMEVFILLLTIRGRSIFLSNYSKVYFPVIKLRPGDITIFPNIFPNTMDKSIMVFGGLSLVKVFKIRDASALSETISINVSSVSVLIPR